MEPKDSVAKFIDKKSNWKDALINFRKILQNTELQETIKWGQLVYALNGKNVVGMGAFKSYVGLWFFQGVFLKDPDNVLVNAQEGKTKALRQLRFSNMDEIDYDLVKAYNAQAVQNQKAGKEIKADANKALIIPEEFQQALNDVNLVKSFAQFTPGRQREFTEHIAEAKQEATRKKRLKKVIPMITDGIGLNAKYRK